MTARIARQRGCRVIGVDIVPERIEMARNHGIEVIDGRDAEDVPDAIRSMTGGRGTDSVVDAVGMEAHGSPAAEMMQRATGLMPRPVAAGMMERVGIDRMAALMDAFDAVRRGGTVSITGVYGGMTDPMPMLRLFDKGVNIRMGQAHVKRWIDDIMPLLTDDSDPLDVEGLATHKVPLDQAPRAYEIFQKKQDGAIKIVLKP
jgi:threonine dehydrogenase-like Zn-dependent dehydrogenase